MKKSYKMSFILMLTTSTTMATSSYSWFSMWMGLEINLLSMIPLMNEDKNNLSAESTMKYFIVQAMSSTIILLSVMMTTSKTHIPSMITSVLATLLMNSALLTKMGMAPFHFWFPEVMEGISWINCMLILTWQKIAPMVILMYNTKLTTFISTMITWSMIISGMMSVNQISLRKILSYSSINHMGWMISSMMIKETVWMYYLGIYSLISINMIKIMKNLKMYSINQLIELSKTSLSMKKTFMLNFMGLSGMPPFPGFIMKWFTIQALVQKNLVTLPLTMVILTMITMYMYIRISLLSTIIKKDKMNWKTSLSMKKVKNMNSALTNFISVSSIPMITITFNMN